MNAINTVAVAADKPEFHIFLSVCKDSLVMKDALHVINSIYAAVRNTQIAHIHIIHTTNDTVFENEFKKVLEVVQAYVIDRETLTVSYKTTTIPHSKIGLFRYCATARLMLATDFPDIEVGLYLDTDAYVVGNLDMLFNQLGKFTSQQWCGMTLESERQHNWYHINRAENDTTWYTPQGLNSGVMLVNFTKWRATNFTQFALNYSGVMTLGDQDILNAYFAEHRDEIFELPCVWNQRARSWCDPRTGTGIFHGNRMKFREKNRDQVYRSIGLWSGHEDRYVAVAD